MTMIAIFDAWLAGSPSKILQEENQQLRKEVELKFVTMKVIDSL